MSTRKAPRWLLLLALFAFITASLGWQRKKPSATTPTPPAEQITFAGTTPEHGFRLEEGKVLSRSMFQASGPSNIQIEVRDVLVPPNISSQIGSLAGPGLLTVHAGEGSVSFSGKTEQLSAGDVKPIPAGQTLVFGNSGAYPMSLRLYLFEGK